MHRRKNCNLKVYNENKDVIDNLSLYENEKGIINYNERKNKFNQEKLSL